ncbi:extracellular solute-binding protein [Hydrogenibacillus sp. N12]|nr:extracellular solute-binding protein [Hydrogenibacillus sp. N12]
MLMVLTQNPNEQAAAWEWIRFLNSPEALAIRVEETGYLPHRDDWADSPALRSILEERPVLKLARQQLADVVPWPSFSGGHSLEAEQIRIEATEAILSGKKSPSTALEEASEKIRRLQP